MMDEEEISVRPERLQEKPSEAAEIKKEVNTCVKTPNYYVGIGASAGGLEALQEFFTALPANTGAAFIVVQHLSPDFKSMMSQLISKNTKMPIEIASEGILVNKNTLYLIPPRKNMIIAEGRLFLSDQMPDNPAKTPINILLRSLAEDQQHKAIAVILSGTGSDGTHGIVAIKEVGGLVMVQTPESAKFDGMPNSACNTDMVDIVLRPAEIAKRLTLFCNAPLVMQSQTTDDSISSNNHDRLMQSIFELLKRKSAIDFLHYKHTTIARRIERRMRINHIETLLEYRDLLLRNSKELQTLAKELLIGVTRFFRDAEAFQLLRDSYLNKLLDRVPMNKEVRIWVAGCSTGEEAYSMAILLDDLLIARQEVGRPIRIFATDVDRKAIADAGLGRFDLEIKEDIKPQWLEKYFTASKSDYTISPHIRKMVIFATHNAIMDAPFSNIDMVSCRNTLIYFQYSAQRKVLSSLYFALNKEGILFLGASESLGELQSFFEVADDRHKIFLKRTNVKLPFIYNMLAQANKPGKPSGMKPVERVLEAHRDLDKGAVFGFIKDRLIEKFIPTVIILNDEFEALHIYGNAELYLRRMPAGQVVTHIHHLMVESLKIPLTTALSRVEKEKGEVHYCDIPVESITGEQIVVDLQVQYHTEVDLLDSPIFYSVIITDISQKTEKPNKASQSIPFNLSTQTQQRITDLENELIKKQEHLQVTVEELETTNEELQSTNEELMSSNEELQSTNEELQSVNEELYTVNSEYQQKIIELTEVNNDLKNLFATIDLGIIFLDDELRLKKFTQVATRYMNIFETDIGRPLDHFSETVLLYPDLLNDVRNVNSTRLALEKEVILNSGESMFIRILPCQTSEHGGSNDNGIIIFLTNISKLRRTESALVKSQQKFKTALLSSFTPVQDHRHSLSILLVEDSVEDITLFESCFKNITTLDIDLKVVNNCSQAESALIQHKFDVCFFDYYLPDGNGIDFIRRFQNNLKQLAFILLTGTKINVNPPELFSMGVTDFLEKKDLNAKLLETILCYCINRMQIERLMDG